MPTKCVEDLHHIYTPVNYRRTDHDDDDDDDDENIGSHIPHRGRMLLYQYTDGDFRKWMWLKRYIEYHTSVEI